MRITPPRNLIKVSINIFWRTKNIFVCPSYIYIGAQIILPLFELLRFMYIYENLQLVVFSSTTSYFYLDLPIVHVFSMGKKIRS